MNDLPMPRSGHALWISGLVLTLMQPVLAWSSAPPLLSVLLAILLSGVGLRLFLLHRARARNVASAPASPTGPQPQTVRQALQQELQGLAGELERVGLLIQDATEQLGQSYGVLHEQMQAQQDVTLRMLQLVDEAEASMASLRLRLQHKAPAVEIDAAEEASAQHLLLRLEALGRRLPTEMHTLAASRHEMTRCLHQTVRSLQFEDITAQALSAARTHMVRIVEIEAHGVGEGESPLQKAVSQRSLQSGTVELF